MTSDYPQIWEKRGYPEPLVQSTIIGRVIHRAVEIIVKEFHRRGCASFVDPQAIEVMRELGGFSRVIENNIDEILSQYANNPRASGTLQDARRILHGKKGEIREDVRILFSRMFEGRRPTSRDSFSGQSTNGALGLGIHPEVRLVSEEMKWEGVADLIRLSSNECEIRDIKTGVPKEEHADQLRIYSLLWSLDRRKNPKAYSATRLTISYVDADVDVPLLSAIEVSAYKEELMARTKMAQEKAAGRPPEAIPCSENCHYCTVRHLCAAYWGSGTLEVMCKEGQKNPMMDVEIKIAGVHGSRSYDALSVKSDKLSPNTPLILRVPGNTIEYSEGDHVRLLNVSMAKEEDDNENNGLVIISTTRFSEAYIFVES